MKHVIFTLVLGFLAFHVNATTIYVPLREISFIGGSSNCQGADAPPISFTYSTCFSGGGATEGVVLSIDWYKNTTNATTGGTLVSHSMGSTATTDSGRLSYHPTTTDTGTYYYYCVITWDGSGTCATTGTLVSARTVEVSVHQSPAAITGSANVCMGYSVLLSNAVIGGIWSCSLGTGRVGVDSTGLVLGMAPGSATVQYTVGTCAATFSMTVGSDPAVITGANVVCPGSVTTFRNSTSGGTWATSNPSIASVSSTGIVKAISAGTANITYTSGFCFVLRPITVTASAGTIAGSSTVCRSTTTTLSNAVSGGVWSRRNGSGSINITASGVVSGLTVGTATVTYAVGSCYVTHAITVNPIPSSLTGNNTICEGASTAFRSTTTGGTWTASNAAIATVTDAGAIWGLTAGTAVITYSNGTCFVTRNIRVSTQPSDIVGSSSVCVGSSTTLTNATTGGTWSRVNGTGSVNVSSAGSVTGVSAGTATVSYSIGTCRARQTITINVTPATITGSSAVCAGTSTTFTNSVSGGVWSSSDTAIAVVSASGTVTGVTTGTAYITYTIGSCYKVKGITVNNSAGTISGSSTVCNGATVTLTTTATGGTWARNNITGNGTISSTSGAFGGITAGTVMVSYTVGTCRSTRVMTVLANPSTITGPSHVCTTAPATFINTSLAGTWSSSNPTIATINSTNGIVDGLVAGSTTISYNNGCGTAATRTVNVYAAPVITTGTISSIPAGATVANLAFTTTDTALDYLVTWDSISRTAGFSDVAITALTSSPLLLAIPATVMAGNYGGSLTISNSTCSALPIDYSFSVNSGKNVHTYAGIWANGYSGDRGAAVLAKLSNPYDVATDRKGNVFIADYGNGVIRKIAPTGVITTVAGNGTYGFSGDGGMATAAQLSNPISVAVDSFGNLFFSDYNNHVIRKVDASGIITTVAGNRGHAYTGDGGPATAAALNYPVGVEIDYNNDLLICDYINSVIRKVDATGTITTIAGTGTNGYSGDGGAATLAQLNFPRNFITDASGNIFVADYGNNVIRKIDASGIISTIAGTGAVGYTGDGGMATSATFSSPYGIALDAYDNLYVSEKYNFTIRKITPSGSISTYAGNGLPGYTGDEGDATYAKFDQPMGIAIDTNNNIFIADNANFAVRIIGEYNRTPFFSGGETQLLQVCRNASATNINTLMEGTDLDTAQTITWSLLSAPIHGSFAGTAVQTGTGRNLSVSGFTYTPDSGYVGTDSFMVHITDGPTSSNTKVLVNVAGDPNAGTITGGDLVCITSVIRLRDSVLGGYWSSSNTSIAAIDSMGFVTGVSAGLAAITYVKTDACGSSFTTKNIHVVDYPSATVVSAPVPCTGHATTIATSATAGATVRYSINGGVAIDTVLSSGALVITTPTLTGTYNYRLINVHNASCTTNIDRLININPIAMVWQGGASGATTNWNEANNWSCGTLPTVTDDITIPNSRSFYPLIAAADSAFVRNITIGSSANVTLGTYARLQVKGDVYNNNFISGAGKVILNGSATQSLSGLGAISNLEIDNSSSASVASRSRVIISGALTVTNGTFYTSDSVVLSSDSVSTGRVAPIATTGAINGKVRVMQYIPGGYRRYRFYAHPFSHAISLAQMQQCIDITGSRGATHGFTTTTTNAASAFRYDPLCGNSAASYDPGWRPFTAINSTADSNNFNRYQGIRVFLRGKKGEGLGYETYTPSATTIAQSGQLNQGRQVITLRKGSSSGQDYNLIGNPYASPVDIGTVLFNAKQAGNIMGSYYVWNPYMGTGGQFQAMTISSVSATPYYLQANGAFEVRAMNNNDTIVFNESDKSTNVTTSLLRTSNEYVTLNVYDENYHVFDMLNIRFDNNSIAEEDQVADAGKPMGPDFNFYSISADNKKLAIDVRPYDENKTILLGINSHMAMDFIIKADNIAAPAGSNLYLHDKWLGTTTALQQGTEYKFSITKDANSQGDSRFEIALKPTVAIENGITVTMTPNPATDDVSIHYQMVAEGQVTIQVSDVNGVNVYSNTVPSSVNGSVKVPLQNLAPGIYLVAFQSGDQKVVHKLVKE